MDCTFEMGRITKTKTILTVAVAVLFLSSGTLHFVRTADFEKIVPPYLPGHRWLVYISGIAELTGGLGLLIPRLRRSAAWGLTALLIAVFPANVYMATNSIQVTKNPVPQALLWARLPLQAMLIWWVLGATAPPKNVSR